MTRPQNLSILRSDAPLVSCSRISCQHQEASLSASWIPSACFHTPPPTRQLHIREHPSYSPATIDKPLEDSFGYDCFRLLETSASSQPGWIPSKVHTHKALDTSRPCRPRKPAAITLLWVR